MPPEHTIQPLAQACSVSAPQSATGCPLCGGFVVPARGQWRCTRCAFSLCVGCEPHESQDPPSDD